MPPRPDGRAAIGSFIPCAIDTVRVLQVDVTVNIILLVDVTV